MEPRFQALSGREFKQGMDTYTVLDRKPFEEELLGTMDTDIALEKYCAGAEPSRTQVDSFVVARTKLQAGFRRHELVRPCGWGHNQLEPL